MLSRPIAADRIASRNTVCRCRPGLRPNHCRSNALCSLRSDHCVPRLRCRCRACTSLPQVRLELIKRCNCRFVHFANGIATDETREDRIGPSVVLGYSGHLLMGIMGDWVKHKRARRWAELSDTTGTASQRLVVCSRRFICCLLFVVDCVTPQFAVCSVLTINSGENCTVRGYEHYSKRWNMSQSRRPW